MRPFKVAFQCTACGKCCTGKGGKVRVNNREIEAISDYLGASIKEIRSKFIRFNSVEKSQTLKQTIDDNQCIFLENKKCTIYPVRPTQCQTYPFWPQQLLSKYDWTLTARECEGIQLNPIDTCHVIPEERILKESVIHEVHRSGENFTYDEIDSLVSELDADMFVEFQEEVTAKYQRNVIYDDGEVTVLDSFIDGTMPTRSLHFNNRLHLVQSEILLNESGAMDTTKLALDVHRGLCVSLAFITPTESPIRIAMLGAGAGVLPTFMQYNILQDIDMHAVEPYQRVLDVGMKYFDLNSKKKMQLHDTFGEEYLKACSNSSVDLVLVDVENGMIDDMVSAPPASMLKKEFLDDISRILTENGVIAMNMIDLSIDHSGIKRIIDIINPYFDEIWNLKLPNNEILFGIKKTNNSIGNKNMNLSLPLQDIIAQYKTELNRIK